MTDTEEIEDEPVCGLCGELVEGHDLFSPDGETYLCSTCSDTALFTMLTKAVLSRKGGF
jgi:hypothetical protein